jgi:predicted ATPase/DNA-binding CsgD family transcriptional regulator
MAIALDSFIGRETDITQVGALLERSRLVTLTGPGGVGKTRLSMAIAQRATTTAPRFWFVDLSASTIDRREPAQIMAETMEVTLPTTADPAATLAEAFGDGPTLLVLDNCEQVVGPVASLVTTLLNSLPQLKVLATSQRALGVSGESLYPLRGFSVPALGTKGWKTSDAVRLFVERARQVNHRFEAVPQVLEICQRLDGMPLSIELAARWVSALSPDEILSELSDHRFELLTATPGPHGRHASLLAVIDRSYNMLEPEEQDLLRRLSILPGPFDVDAATAVGTLGNASRPQVLQLLRQLVTKSLLTSVRPTLHETLDQRSRFRMLESIQHFGCARAVDAGEEKCCRARLVEWYAKLCSSLADPDVFHFPEELTARLTWDRTNLFAAVEWAREIDDADALRLLGVAMAMVLNQLGSYDKADTLLGTLPEAPDNPVAQCLLLYARAMAALDIGDYDSAHRNAEQLLALSEEASLPVYRIRGSWAHSMVHSYWKMPDAVELQERTAQLAFDFGRPDIGGLINAVRAWRAVNKGDFVLAKQLLNDATSRVNPDLYPDQYAFTLFNLGVIAVHSDLGAAEKKFRDALKMLYADSAFLRHVLGGFLLVASRSGQPEKAMRFAGAIKKLPHRRRTQAAPEWQSMVDEAEATSRGALSTAQATKAFDEGVELSIEEVFTYALQERLPDRMGATSSPVLTSREFEVVRLVSDGLTNRQIATRLTVSSRTVEAHLEHVRGKLGLNSRTQVSAWFAKQQREDDQNSH